MKTHIGVLISLTVAFGSCQNTAQERTSEQTDAPSGLIVEVKKRVPDPEHGERNADHWEELETRTIAHLPGFTPHSEVPKLSRWGGWLEKRVTPTGFFHTTQVDGRWWLVDPDGYLFIHSAVNSVHPGESDRNKQAFAERFGSKENWVEQTKDQFIAHGFNGLGNWSDTEAFRQSPTNEQKPMAYAKTWSFMSSYAKKKGTTYITPGHTGYLKDVIPVFDPEFEAHCDTYAQQAAAFKDDPMLLGHFSDNEMPYLLHNLDGYLSLEQDDPGYRAAKQWLDERSIRPEDITDEHRHEFLAVVADKYFSIVSKALKKWDPNHLYIGSRFHAKERHYEKFLRAAAPYLDVVSINYYRVWTPEPHRMQEWAEWMNKPFMVTEYYVKGEDSGLPNKSGAGWLVKTQEDRGNFYQNFNLGLLEAGNCVGWHYFKYQDNDPTQKGAELSNTDSNKGILDNHYILYTPMTDRMKELNLNMYRLTQYFDQQREL
jgi:hypothetical protein